MTDPLAEYEERRRLEAARKRQQSGHTLGATRKVKVTGHRCRLCNSHRVEAHHVVHRSKMPRGHELLHHADNIIPLCHDHHQDHHTTTRRVPRHALTPDEQRFLLTYANHGWAARWYPED